MTRRKGASAPYSFEQAARAYLTRRTRGKTTNAAAERFMVRFKGLAASDVDGAEIDDFITDRMTEVEGATVRREVTTLMAILRMAHTSGRIAVMPAAVRPRDSEPRLRFLSEEEAARLLAVEGMDEERRLAAFILNTGARVGEAVATTASDVDLVEEEFTFRSRKGTGELKVRRVPINSVARVAVGHLETGVSGRLFKWTNSAAASAALNRLASFAGVEDFTSHDLRRTFASRLLCRGVDTRTVAELLGHSSLVMVMRYAIPSRGLLRSAVQLLQDG